MKNKTSRRNHIACNIELLEARIAPAVFTVKNLNNTGADSLRQAIIDADALPGSDTIVFKTGLKGTILLASELLIDSSAHPLDKLTINGPGGNKIIIDGNNNSRIFDITDGSTATDSPVSISGLALIHGNGTGLHGSGTGGAVYSYESLTLKNCTISGNTADNAGGVRVAAKYTTGATAKVMNCVVSGNSAANSGYGGGLDLSVDKAISISGSLITGNSATISGGGIYAKVVNTTSATGITISHSRIIGNTAPLGGGVAVKDFNLDPTSKININSSTITGNSASTTTGGGIYIGAGNAVLNGNNIRANTAKTAGGGIEATLANSLKITGGSITGNGSSTSGGGLNIAGGAHPLTISGTHISDNHATGSGGGVNLTSVGVVKLMNVIMHGNTSGGSGGGLLDTSSTSTSIFGGEFANNVAGFGGGFDIYNGPSVDIHSTKITGNVASTAGGGYLGASGANSTITAIGLIVTGNQSGGIGGGLEFGSFNAATLTLKGSTISSNHAKTSGGGIYLAAGLTSTSAINGTKITHNIADTSGGGVFQASGGLITLDPAEIALITGNVAPTDPDRHNI